MSGWLRNDAIYFQTPGRGLEPINCHFFAIFVQPYSGLILCNSYSVQYFAKIISLDGRMNAKKQQLIFSLTALISIVLSIYSINLCGRALFKIEAINKQEKRFSTVFFLLKYTPFLKQTLYAKTVLLATKVISNRVSTSK